MCEYSSRRFKVAAGRLFAGAAMVIAAAVHPLPAAAQEVERIAAVVNDAVISIYDLRQRVALLISSAGLPDTPDQRRRIAPQVLRGLIDETLQKQEAARLNIKVNKSELEKAISNIERMNNIPPGQFEEFIRKRGVPLDAAIEQIRASIAWEKLLGRRVIPGITIGEEDIDAVIERVKANQAQTRFQVAEIVLPIDDPAQDQAVRELAERLVGQLRQGANFGAIARQFSKSASAATDGNIGWIAAGELSGAANAALSQLSAGDISDPVVTADSIVILRLIAEQPAGTGGAANARVQLRQMMLPLDEKASPDAVQGQMDIARKIVGTTRGCAAFADTATQMGTPQTADPAELRLGDLNESLRNAVSGLSVGEASAPIRTPTGIQVIMLCGRDDADGPDRSQIRETLMRQRIDMMARRYLRDLRRAAFVDLRV